MNTLAFYITSHGHGHAARSCDLLAALHRHVPNLPLIVVSTVEPAFLRSRLAGIPYRQRRVSLDVGLVQLDSIRGNPEATLGSALRLMQNRSRLVKQEVRFLREEQIAMVVSDIPSLPFEAAARERIPAIGVGNFSWNWIYADYVQTDPRWRPVIQGFEEGYAKADLLIRLPFHEPMTAFRTFRDVPLFSRPGRNRRVELAARSGCSPATTWVLISVSSLDWTGEALARLSAMTDFSFWTVQPLQWDRPGFHSAEREIFPYADVLASCDVVLTKPGYGIVSECVVNCKPMVYARREGFAETPILIEGIEHHLRHASISLADLYSGHVEPALRAALHAAAPERRMDAGGDDQAANLILSAMARRAAAE